MSVAFCGEDLAFVDEVNPQSTELTRGPSNLVQHFCLQRDFTSAQERCMSYIWYGLAISLAYPSGEERGNLLVQWLFLPVFVTRRWRGWGGRHPVGLCKCGEKPSLVWMRSTQQGWKRFNSPRINPQPSSGTLESERRQMTRFYKCVKKN